MSAARIALLAACVLVAGCGAFGIDTLEDDTPGVMRGTTQTPVAAQAAVRLGGTKPDVKAALGTAGVVTFDTGWEVWVYRWPGATRAPGAATELVVLFNPQGVVAKTRIRPGA